MSPQRAFGEKLRLAREGRGVSLQTIAQDTKIGTPLLTALEKGDCSRWPAGVYSRAYVRTYAQAVGLDPKEIAEEFCERFPAIAWPEGPPGALPDADPRSPGFAIHRYPVPDQVADVEPLRLTLDPMPSDRWRLLRSGVAKRLAECAAGVLVAAAASLFGMDFWMALSAASLAVQARHLA